MKAVFIRAWGGPQYASTIKPILEEMQKRGHDVKWGDYSDEADVFIYTNAPWEEARLSSIRKHDFWHPHGLGAEYVENEDCAEKLDFMLTRGPMEQEKYVKKYPQWSWEFRMIGYPKNDLMWKKEGQKKALCLAEKLGLSQPTITFTGTYGLERSTSEWTRNEEGVLKALNELENEDCVYKPHMGNVAYDQVYNLGFFERARKKYTRVKWVDPNYNGSPSPYLKAYNVLSDGDITPLLMVTDVLIADDFSGVLNEFLPLDRPFVKIGEVGIVCPFGLTCNVDNIHEHLQHAFADPQEFSVERKEWLNKIMYKPDGHASERAANVIKEAME